MAQSIVPKPVRRGDLVRVIAPAGPFEPEPFEAGLARLREHFRVHVDPNVAARHGFFAGPDARRLAELDTALRCPEAGAIIAARGGVGSTRIAQFADFGALREHPKWLVGFSDITALHCEAQRVRVASLHAHNVTGLGRCSDAEYADWMHALGEPLEPRVSAPLEVLRGGHARGPLAGGNLSLVHAAALCGRWAPKQGSILFLEEVGEAPYRIDRMLAALRLSGALRAIAGIVVGEISDAPPGPHGVTAREVFTWFATEVQLPVLWGYPAGHTGPNRPLHLGMIAELAEARFTSALRSGRRRGS